MRLTTLQCLNNEVRNVIAQAEAAMLDITPLFDNGYVVELELTSMYSLINELITCLKGMLSASKSRTLMGGGTLVLWGPTHRPLQTPTLTMERMMRLTTFFRLYEDALTELLGKIHNMFSETVELDNDTGIIELWEALDALDSVQITAALADTTNDDQGIGTATAIPADNANLPGPFNPFYISPDAATVSGPASNANSPRSSISSRDTSSGFTIRSSDTAPSPTISSVASQEPNDTIPLIIIRKLIHRLVIAMIEIRSALPAAIPGYQEVIRRPVDRPTLISRLQYQHSKAIKVRERAESDIKAMVELSGVGYAGGPEVQRLLAMARALIEQLSLEVIPYESQMTLEETYSFVINQCNTLGEALVQLCTAISDSTDQDAELEEVVAQIQQALILQKITPQAAVQAGPTGRLEPAIAPGTSSSSVSGVVSTIPNAPGDVRVTGLPGGLLNIVMTLCAAVERAREVFATIPEGGGEAVQTTPLQQTAQALAHACTQAAEEINHLTSTGTISGPGVPQLVTLVRSAIRQIIQALIENAVSFSQEESAAIYDVAFAVPENNPQAQTNMHMLLHEALCTHYSELSHTLVSIINELNLQILQLNIQTILAQVVLASEPIPSSGPNAPAGSGSEADATITIPAGAPAPGTSSSGTTGVDRFRELTTNLAGSMHELNVFLTNTNSIPISEVTTMLIDFQAIIRSLNLDVLLLMLEEAASEVQDNPEVQELLLQGRQVVSQLRATVDRINLTISSIDITDPSAIRVLIIESCGELSSALEQAVRELLELSRRRAALQPDTVSRPVVDRNPRGDPGAGGNGGAGSGEAGNRSGTGEANSSSTSRESGADEAGSIPGASTNIRGSEVSTLRLKFRNIARTFAQKLKGIRGELSSICSCQSEALKAMDAKLVTRLWELMKTLRIAADEANSQMDNIITVASTTALDDSEVITLCCGLWDKISVLHDIASAATKRLIGLDPQPIYVELLTLIVNLHKQSDMLLRLSGPEDVSYPETPGPVSTSAPRASSGVSNTELSNEAPANRSGSIPAPASLFQRLMATKKKVIGSRLQTKYSLMRAVKIILLLSKFFKVLHFIFKVAASQKPVEVVCSHGLWSWLSQPSSLRSFLPQCCFEGLSITISDPKKVVDLAQHLACKCQTASSALGMPKLKAVHNTFLTQVFMQTEEPNKVPLSFIEAALRGTQTTTSNTNIEVVPNAFLTQALMQTGVPFNLRNQAVPATSGPELWADVIMTPAVIASWIFPHIWVHKLARARAIILAQEATVARAALGRFATRKLFSCKENRDMYRRSLSLLPIEENLVDLWAKVQECL
jgi:hypothetical protein